MHCEVLAIGTELLLGQINDTNSSWIGGRLATVGIDSYYQTKVGDNLDRIVGALELALSRSDAVITTGGLGPTQDDITRNAIAMVAGVGLEYRQDLADRIEKMFSSRGRAMPDNNLLQAYVPAGGDAIPVQPGTAPGLVVPVGDKVIYAVPGVPWEMHAMFDEFILEDLRNRAGITAVIKSRTLRTWGMSESGLATQLADEIERIDAEGGATLAFLASGIEGLKVRLTAKADSEVEADEILAEADERVRAIVGERIIFGVDDETMESAVLNLCRAQGLTLGVAESLTGGLIASRIVDIPGCSDVFKGSLVTYATAAKHDLLGVPDVSAVSADAAEAMALGACAALRTDVAVAATGVAGPEPADGHKPGTVFVATAVDGEAQSQLLEWPFDRVRTRQFSTITAMNALRLRLLDRANA